MTTGKSTTRFQQPGERSQNYPSDSSVTPEDMAATRAYKVARLDLIPVAANGFCFVWQNPGANKIILRELIVRITTAGGTATAVLDIDVVANATATGNTIFDGIDLDATAVLSSHNVTDSGSSGNEKPHVVDEKAGSNDWVTGKCLVEKSDDLVGAVYIFYTEV